MVHGLPDRSAHLFHQHQPRRPALLVRAAHLISQEPPIVTQNKGNGTWIDFWVICDTANCHLLFSDDNGHIYRAQTSLANFPNGFGNTQMVMSDTKNNLFEATNVYKVADSDQYLLLQEAISNTSGRRYFRSFTSSSLTGSWTPGRHGERTLRQPQQRHLPRRSLDPGHQPRRDGPRRQRPDPDHQSVPTAVRLPGHGSQRRGDYIRLPWRMGLLTQTNSTC